MKGKLVSLAILAAAAILGIACGAMIGSIRVMVH